MICLIKKSPFLVAENKISEDYFGKASAIYQTMIKDLGFDTLKREELEFAEAFHIIIVCIFDLKRVISGIDYLESYYEESLSSELDRTPGGGERWLEQDNSDEREQDLSWGSESQNELTKPLQSVITEANEEDEQSLMLTERLRNSQGFQNEIILKRSHSNKKRLKQGSQVPKLSKKVLERAGKGQGYSNYAKESKKGPKTDIDKKPENREIQPEMSQKSSSGYEVELKKPSKPALDPSLVEQETLQTTLDLRVDDTLHRDAIINGGNVDWTELRTEDIRKADVSFEGMSPIGDKGKSGPEDLQADPEPNPRPMEEQLAAAEPLEESPNTYIKKKKKKKRSKQKEQKMSKKKISKRRQPLNDYQGGNKTDTFQVSATGDSHLDSFVLVSSSFDLSRMRDIKRNLNQNEEYMADGKVKGSMTSGRRFGRVNSGQTDLHSLSKREDLGDDFNLISPSPNVKGRALNEGVGAGKGVVGTGGLGGPLEGFRDGRKLSFARRPSNQNHVSSRYDDTTSEALTSRSQMYTEDTHRSPKNLKNSKNLKKSPKGKKNKKGEKRGPEKLPPAPQQFDKTEEIKDSILKMTNDLKAKLKSREKEQSESDKLTVCFLRRAPNSASSRTHHQQSTQKSNHPHNQSSAGSRKADQSAANHNMRGSHLGSRNNTKDSQDIIGMLPAKPRATGSVKSRRQHATSKEYQPQSSNEDVIVRIKKSAGSLQNSHDRGSLAVRKARGGSYGRRGDGEEVVVAKRLRYPAEKGKGQKAGNGGYEFVGGNRRSRKGVIRADTGSSSISPSKYKLNNKLKSGRGQGGQKASAGVSAGARGSKGAQNHENLNKISKKQFVKKNAKKRSRRGGSKHQSPRHAEKPIEVAYDKSPIKYSKRGSRLPSKGKSGKKRDQVDSLERKAALDKRLAENVDKIPPKQPSSRNRSGSGSRGRLRLRGSQISTLKREIAKERNRLMSDLNHRLLDELRRNRKKTG